MSSSVRGVTVSHSIAFGPRVSFTEHGGAVGVGACAKGYHSLSAVLCNEALIASINA